MPRDYVRTRPSSNNRGPRREKSSGSGLVWLLAGILIGLIIVGIFYVKNHPISAFSKQTLLSSLPSEKKPVSPQLIQPPQASVKTPVSEKKASPEALQTQFDFYNVLPSQKVMGPSGDEDTASLETTAPSVPSSDPEKIQSAVPIETENSGGPPDEETDVTPKNQSSDRSENIDKNTTASGGPAKAVPAIARPKIVIPPPFKSSAYILQVGAFKQYGEADRLKAQLMLLGFDVKVTSLQKNGKTLQRVWLGPFHSLDEAQSMLEQLKENAVSAKLLKSAF